jgi:serine/threonine-protein kinase RsbW
MPSALFPYCSTCSFDMVIPADPAAIETVSDGVTEMLRGKHWDEAAIMEMELALQEGLANAIRHGCKNDRTKQVRCLVSADASGEVVVVIRDPGPGFDPATVANPLTSENRVRPNGRGIFLIKQLVDEVRFADRGRELRLRKRPHALEAAASFVPRRS